MSPNKKIKANKHRIVLIIWLSFFAVLSSCNKPSENKLSDVILLQPIDNFPSGLTNEVYNKIKALNKQTFLCKTIPAPPGSYYAPRHRYRADSIISFLKNNTGKDTIIVGLTSFDISTSKNGHKDWGIMGLGYRPGNACVVSTFRLSKKNLKEQFFKVVLHEIGHTKGLPHCPVASCYMRDANGGNHLNEEHSFCTHCKTFLRKRGLILN